MWKPHEPLNVESTFDAFVKSAGGYLVADRLPKSPAFENADYLFESPRVIVELKTLQTEFGPGTRSFDKRFDQLMRELTTGDRGMKVIQAK